MQTTKALSALSLSLLLVSCCERETYAHLKIETPQQEVATKPTETSITITGEMPLPQRRFLPVTKKVHALIRPHSGEMKPYTETVPRADNAKFDLVPIPGGTFTIGSPADEPNRNDDEGPQRKIKIEPFWMATTETTWGLYRAFMENGIDRNKDGTLNTDYDIVTPDPPLRGNPDLIDAISQPTPPHKPMHFELGNSAGYAKDLPAIAMTQHSASKFCEWLTAQTGRFYRLPTEAEWEYACRAETTTAYSFGDDPAKLDDFGWHKENSDFTYQPVAKKKPNPWGLYDMHGNVSEWTLDFYQPSYRSIKNGTSSPLTLSKMRYPRVTRGGNWEASPQDLRSAARLPSDISWKTQDPQAPKSLWYFTDNWSIGFRVVRPAAIPTVEEAHLLWNTGPGEPY